jgi:hypothetical protein
MILLGATMANCGRPSSAVNTGRQGASNRAASSTSSFLMSLERREGKPGVKLRR